MLTVYLKPTCSTCRALVELLDERRVDYEAIDYYKSPIGSDRLRELVAMTGRGAREILRTRDRPELAVSAHTDDELIELIAADPDLVLRPIVVLGDSAVVARPPGRVLELLDDNAA